MLELAQLGQCGHQHGLCARAHAFESLEKRELVFKVMLQMPVCIVVNLSDLAVQLFEHRLNALALRWGRR